MFQRNYKKSRIPTSTIFVFLGLFLFMGVGYSLIESMLEVKGELSVSETSWDIHFENFDYALDNVTNDPVVVTDATSIELNTVFENIGDKYEFSFDIKNNGTLPALIEAINNISLNDNQKKYIDYSFTYLDGTEIQENDLIKATESKRVHVLIQYKNLRDDTLYPEEDLDIHLSMGIKFYFPEEEKYTVLLNVNGENQELLTTNIEQEIKIENIEETYKVIACNHDAFVTTNENSEVFIKNIKQDVVCHLEENIKDAVGNSLDEKTNITILSDDTTNHKVTLLSTQDITLDLNGKTYIIDSDTNDSCIVVNGKLKIKDSIGTGILKTLDTRLIESNEDATLTIEGGSYGRENVDTTTSLMSLGGVVTIKNATLESDNSSVIFIGKSNTLVNINSCSLESTMDKAIVNTTSNSIMNVRNSMIKASTSGIYLYSDTNQTNTLYLCNTTISDSVSDFDFGGVSGAKIYYSSDSIFINGTNVPTFSNTYASNVSISEKACAE